MKPITVDGGKRTVELDAEGVLHVAWKPGTVLQADDVHAAMASVNELADGAEYPMLIDMVNTQAVTRQAKPVFSVKCAPSRIALLGSSRSIVSLPTSLWHGGHSRVPPGFSPPAKRLWTGFSRHPLLDARRGRGLTAGPTVPYRTKTGHP